MLSSQNINQFSDTSNILLENITGIDEMLSFSGTIINNAMEKDL